MVPGWVGGWVGDEWWEGLAAIARAAIDARSIIGRSEWVWGEILGQRSTAAAAAALLGMLVFS